MLTRGGLLILFSLGILLPLYARVTIEIVKTSSPPNIDGVLDDPVWQEAKGYSEYKMFYPEYGQLPKEKTTAYSAYDNHNLYFAFKCDDSEPDKIVGTITKRDTIGREDVIGILIDSQNDGQNAYFFLVNSLGIQQDGIMDSQDDNSWSPDFIWESMSKKNDTGYTVEVRIPFKALRFTNSKVVTMGISYTRVISRYSEQYSFPEWDAKGSTLEYLGEVHLEGIKYARVFQVLPSFTFLKHRERTDDGTLASFDDKNLGLTSKLGLTSNLTLDFALNPDFSHIEVDEAQVDVNLRTEPLYEEKRPFFLEGLEHFEFAGSGDDSPIEKIVHTRNIIAPIWGLKLTGKLGRTDVINSLFAVDESAKANAPPVPLRGTETGNSYYGVFRYKHLGKSDSYIGAIYTGKEFEFNTSKGDERGYNRVGGIDTRLRLGGYITLDAFFLYSFNNLFNEHLELAEKTEGAAFGGKFNYEDRHYLFALDYYDIAPDFILASGWLLRNGIRTISSKASRYFYPNSKLFKLITLNYTGRYSRDTHFNMNEYSHALELSFQMPLDTILNLKYELATEVFAGICFDKNALAIAGTSRPIKQINFTFQYLSGDSPYYRQEPPFQGYLKILSLSLNFQPLEKFSSQFNWQNHIFHGDVIKANDYNISIYRNKTIFQVNKYLSLRGIVEYDSSEKKLLTDALLEFTYIPGTVIHLGYGSTFSKEFHSDIRDLYYNRFREIRSGLFFKASYLFRF